MPLYQRKVEGDTPAQARKRPWVLVYPGWSAKEKKWKRFAKTFDRKGDAEKWREENGKDIRSKRHVPDSQSITVQEAAERWIAARAAGTKRGSREAATASTLRQYRYHADTYIVPRLGGVKLCDLGKADIETFANGLLRDKSRALTKKVLTSLKSLLTHSDVSIPFPSVGSASHEIDETTVPSVADVRVLIAKLDELASQPNKQRAKAWRRYRALLLTAIHTGMRASEVRGLAWDAVDFTRCVVHVRQRADENGTVEPVTKSKAGKRTIPIPASLVALLRAWKLEAGRHALVFATSSGAPLSLPNIYNRAWKPLLLAAGIADPETDENGDVVRDAGGRPQMKPRYNFHMLRHFHASRLIASGANPKEVQSEMGHASIQITFDIYGHLFSDDEATKRRAETAERLAGELHAAS